MIRLRAAARRLRRDEAGAAIVEMALLAVPLFMTLFVLFDFGWRMYAQSVLEGTLQRAARQATIGDKTSTQIDNFIRAQLALFSKTRPPEIVKKSYYEFSGITKPPVICADDGDGVLEPARGEYLKDPGKDGLGGSDDVVYYTVSLTFPRFLPVRWLGWAREETVSANMVLRNQPYGSQAIASC